MRAHLRSCNSCSRSPLGGWTIRLEGCAASTVCLSAQASGTRVYGYSLCPGRKLNGRLPIEGVERLGDLPALVGKSLTRHSMALA